MHETVDDRAAHLRTKLVDDLLRSGVLRDSRWSQAFREVDRHAFLPKFFRQRTDGDWSPIDSAHSEWLSLVYRDRVCVTQLNGHDGAWEQALRDGAVSGVPTSSSSMPTIMAIMLEALRVRQSHRVLEIGTGTGYNAALLSHALGDDQVTTIDVDPDVLRRAQALLAAAGYHPTCVAGDGALGYPDRAPYDRVLCTCAVSRIPVAWLEQTVPGGLVVTTLNRTIGAGLVRIVADGAGSGEGRVLVEDGRFMPLRAHTQSWSATLLEQARTARTTDHRATGLPASAVVDPGSPFEFFAGLALADVVVGHGPRGRVHLAHPDGSWVRLHAREGGTEVEQGGPRQLWDLTEDAYRQWRDLDQPRRERFGITVTPTAQHLWLDRPDSGLTWPL